MEAAEQSKHDRGVSIPEDIVFDVLARLPAKALCRFRCVSKAWRALISDPTFVAEQRSRAGPHLVAVLAGRWPPEVRMVDMDGNVVRVLEVRPLGKEDDDGNDHILGVQQQQATTQLYFVLYREKPIHASAMIVDPAAGCACAVDTYTLEIKSSFGRASPSATLKVLHLQETLDQQICTVATIVDGGAEPLRWRQRSSPPFVTCSYPGRRATVNGVVYFLPPLDNEYAAASTGSHRIAAFDLESEEWKTINGPTFRIQYIERYFQLTEYNGTLAFVQYQRERKDGEHYYAIVWLLVDIDRSVWVKECTIQMPKIWVLITLLGALDDGGILLLVNELEKRKKHYNTSYRGFFVSYNPNTKTFKKLEHLAKGFGDISDLYTRSLLS